jgi:hypothetical protein
MKPEIASLGATLDRLAVDDFTMGSDWAAVHDLCQANEGEAPFDWAHAFCHRIEGDDWNAAYWYRRAGKPVATGSFAGEWAAMKTALDALR